MLKYAGMLLAVKIEWLFSNSDLYEFMIEGVDGLSEWVQDPTRPDTTLSWHIISGK